MNRQEKRKTRLRSCSILIMGARSLCGTHTHRLLSFLVSYLNFILVICSLLFFFCFGSHRWWLSLRIQSQCQCVVSIANISFRFEIETQKREREKKKSRERERERLRTHIEQDIILFCTSISWHNRL